MRWPRLRGSALMAAAVTVVTIGGCQPVDDFAQRPTEAPPRAASSPLGAPVRGLPANLAALLERTDPVAREWQDEPRVAEIRVDLGARRRWVRAEVTYLAANADRLLIVRLDAEGLRRSLSTLATLGLRPVTRRGLAALPELPAGVREPADLAEATRSALRRCGAAARENAVLYATGAPVSWDGRRWTAPPAWTATVLTVRGGVQVDPLTGDDLRCATPD